MTPRSFRNTNASTHNPAATKIFCVVVLLAQRGQTIVHIAQRSLQLGQCRRCLALRCVGTVPVPERTTLSSRKYVKVADWGRRNSRYASRRPTANLYRTNNQVVMPHNKERTALGNIFVDLQLQAPRSRCITSRNWVMAGCLTPV